jgi:hypothetical protein
MFPKLPSIGKDIHNRLIISPEHNEFTFPSASSPISIDGDGSGIMRKTKRLKAKTKTNSRHSLGRKNQIKIDKFKLAYDKRSSNNIQVQNNNMQ